MDCLCIYILAFDWSCSSIHELCSNHTCASSLVYPRAFKFACTPSNTLVNVWMVQACLFSNNSKPFSLKHFVVKKLGAILRNVSLLNLVQIDSMLYKYAYSVIVQDTVFSLISTFAPCEIPLAILTQFYVEIAFFDLANIHGTWVTYKSNIIIQPNPINGIKFTDPSIPKHALR